MASELVHLPESRVFGNCRFSAERIGPSIVRFAIHHTLEPAETLTHPPLGHGTPIRLLSTHTLFSRKCFLPVILSISFISVPLALLTLILWAVFLRPSKIPTLETLDVIESVGLQISTEFSDGSKDVLLVPESDIENFMVNEAAAGFRIRTFLAIVRKQSCDCSNGKSGQLVTCVKCSIQDACVLPFAYTQLPISLAAEILFAVNKWVNE